MARVSMILLRLLQALVAVVNIVFTSMVVNWYITRTASASPCAYNFLLFAPAFAIVSIVYLELAPRLTPCLSHPNVSLFLELTNATFFAGGVVSVAVFLSRVVYCSGHICFAGRATVVAAGVELVLWAVTTALTVRNMLRRTSELPYEFVKPQMHDQFRVRASQIGLAF